MIINSEKVFKNLPENSSDDLIIELALAALHENDMGKGYVFRDLRDRYDKAMIKRIINRMETNDLVTVSTKEYEDIYEHNILITKHGTSIASSNGWIAYLRSQKTEANWIDEVLEDAKKSYVSLCRATPDEYQRAVGRAEAYKLIKEVASNTYSLIEEGEYALELGGFIEWKKDRKRKRDDESRPLIITGNNSIIGNNNSGVIQALDGALINTGNKVRIDSFIEINKKNIEDLVRKLSDNYVSQHDIEELKIILESDNPKKEKEIFGDKTNNWILKMISKSLDGTWQIGVGAAGGLLAEVIKTFYGWQ